MCIIVVQIHIHKCEEIHPSIERISLDINTLWLTSNSALLILVELAFDETQHQAGLAHGRLSQQDQFELAYFVPDGGGTIGPRWSTSPRHANRPDNRRGEG